MTMREREREREKMMITVENLNYNLIGTRLGTRPTRYRYDFLVDLVTIILRLEEK